MDLFLKLIVDSYKKRNESEYCEFASAGYINAVDTCLKGISDDGLNSFKTNDLQAIDWVRRKIGTTTIAGQYRDSKPEQIVDDEFIRNAFDTKKVRFLGKPAFLAEGSYFEGSKTLETTIVAGAWIDIFVFVASGTVIQAFAKVGANCFIRHSVNIGKFVDIVDSPVDNPTEINDGTVIDSYARIGSSVGVGKNTFIGERASIGNKVEIGDNVIIKKGTTIKPGITIPNDTTAFNLNIFGWKILWIKRNKK